MKHVVYNMQGAFPHWRRIEEVMLVASDDATSGSVMAKHDRMRPCRSGTSQRFCCSSVPYLANTCRAPMLTEQMGTAKFPAIEHNACEHED